MRVIRPDREAAVNDTSTLTADGIEVAGARRPLLPVTSVVIETGSVVAAVGEPGHGHTALALALSGRLATKVGTVDIDGRSNAGELQQAVALVDVPGVSEPDDLVSLATIVGEELAMARRHATRKAVRGWLHERDLAPLEHWRMEDIPGVIRMRVLAELATNRPHVRFLVVPMPERHGDDFGGYLDEARLMADWGYGVLVTASPSAASLLDVPVHLLGAEVTV